MRIMPNKTIVEGKVNSVEPSSDGWGADVEFLVETSEAAAGFSDFLHAEPGTVVRAFAAQPDGIRPGQKYSLTTSVLGGPQGERVVIEDAQAKP